MTPQPKGRGLALIEALNRRRIEEEAAARVRNPLETIPEEECTLVEEPNPDPTKSDESEQLPCGDVGTPIDLHANFLRLEALNAETSAFYEYNVKFDDKSDLAIERKRLILGHPEIPKEANLFNGTRLILPCELERLHYECERDDIKRIIDFKFVEKLALNDKKMLPVYNAILNNCFRAMKLFPDRRTGTRGGRSYYDPVEKKNLVQEKIEIWPGYITNVSCHENNVLIGFDSCSKIIRQETVRDIMTNIYKKGAENYVANLSRELIGQSVFTRVNNRTYKIREIAMDKTPEFEFPLSNGTTMSIMEYFQQKYGIKIQDSKQPLLVAEVKKYPEARGDEVEILIVPELCFLTGLTENQRNDYRIMKKVADFTRLKPTIR